MPGCRHFPGTLLCGGCETDLSQSSLKGAIVTGLADGGVWGQLGLETRHPGLAARPCVILNVLRAFY